MVRIPAVGVFVEEVGRASSRRIALTFGAARSGLSSGGLCTCRPGLLVLGQTSLSQGPLGIECGSPTNRTDCLIRLIDCDHAFFGDCPGRFAQLRRVVGVEPKAESTVGRRDLALFAGFGDPEDCVWRPIIRNASHCVREYASLRTRASGPMKGPGPQASRVCCYRFFAAFAGAAIGAGPAIKVLWTMPPIAPSQAMPTRIQSSTGEVCANLGDPVSDLSVGEIRPATRAPMVTAWLN